MRRLLKTVIVLVVLLGILAVADQVGRVVAERRIASAVQSSQDLGQTPGVSVAGWPFATQALSGSYDGGTITVRGLTESKLHIDRLDVRLTGVHEPLSKLIHSDLSGATADQVDATVHLTFADLAQASGVSGLKLSGSSGRLGVSRTVHVLGVSADLIATARLVVLGGKLQAEDVHVKAGAVPFPQSVSEAAFNEVLDALSPGSLPYGLNLSGVTVTSTGVDLAAQAQNVKVTGGGTGT